MWVLPDEGGRSSAQRLMCSCQLSGLTALKWSLFELSHVTIVIDGAALKVLCLASASGERGRALIITILLILLNMLVLTVVEVILFF